MTETIRYITDRLNESARAADQIDLLTGEPNHQVTAEEAINAVERDFNQRKQQEQRVRPSQDLFGANPARIGDNNKSGAGISGSTQGSQAESERLVKPDKDQFANNKLFTADMVAAARARLKSKIGNLNSGLDPEILIDGMTIAGTYIESGIRTFSTYAKVMTEGFGENIKPYLLSFWEGTRHYPEQDTEGMTSAAESA